MDDKKIIAVVGATGAQVSGLVRAIANDPGSGFAVRAITRKVQSEKAQALAKLGADVAAADRPLGYEIINLGRGDPAQLKPRNPRLDFDEACRVL